MGSGSATTVVIQNNASPPANAPVPPPPDFMQNLIKWINLLYSPVITYSGDPGTDDQNLENSLLNLTTNKFLAQYNYGYMGANSLPPKCADQNTISGYDDFVYCASNNAAAITNYVNKIIIPNSGLPSAYVRQATNDFNNAVTSYLQSLSSGWQTTTYQRKYSDPTNVTPKYAIDAMFTWTTINAVDYQKNPPAQTPTLFMRFVGVCYASH